MKKGFTLVEIIISLALITLIGTFGIVGITKKNKEDNLKKIQIKEAGTTYLSINEITGQCISINELIEDGYLKEEDYQDYKDKYLEFSVEEDGTKIMTISDTENCKYQDTYYKLKYDLNGGQITFLSNGTENTYENEYIESYKYNQVTKIKEAIVKRKKDEFLGLATTKDGDIKYKAGDTITIYKDTTLYAIWDKRTCVVTYNLNAKEGYKYNDIKEYASYLYNPVTSEQIAFNEDGTYSVDYDCGTTVDVLDAKSELVEVDYWVSNDETIYNPVNNNTTLNNSEISNINTQIILDKEDVELTASQLVCWLIYDCPESETNPPCGSIPYKVAYTNACLNEQEVQITEITPQRDNYNFYSFYNEANPSSIYFRNETIKLNSSETVLKAKWNEISNVWIIIDGNIESFTFNSIPLTISGDTYKSLEYPDYELTVGTKIIVSITHTASGDAGPANECSMFDVKTTPGSKSATWELTYKGGSGDCNLYISEKGTQEESGDVFDGGFDFNDSGDFQWSPDY